MKSVITGSHGFLGQHLCKKLKQMGHTLVLLKRGESAPKEFDFFFHLAAYGNHSNQTNEKEMKKANIDLLWKYLSETKDTQYKVFINISTSSVTLPIQTFYSATKHAGEHICEAFSNTYKKKIVSIRPYSLYGPGEADFRFIPTVCRALLKDEIIYLDPKPIHDWLYIEDFIKYLIGFTYHNFVISGSVYSVGTGKGWRNEYIVQSLENISKKKAKIINKHLQRPYDTTGWISPYSIKHVPIERGLEKTFNWYKKYYGSQKKNT